LKRKKNSSNGKAPLTNTRKTKKKRNAPGSLHQERAVVYNTGRKVREKIKKWKKKKSPAREKRTPQSLREKRSFILTKSPPGKLPRKYWPMRGRVIDRPLVISSEKKIVGTVFWSDCRPIGQGD